MRCYYRKIRWVNATEDALGTLPWEPARHVTPAVGGWQTGKCTVVSPEVFRRHRSEYESHTNSTHGRPRGHGIGRGAGSTTEIQRSRGQDKSSRRQLYRRL